MLMESPRVLKLKNGDLIISVVRESETEGALWLHNPIMAMPFASMNGDQMGETFLLKPWIGISDDKDFMIRKSDVLLSCSLRESLVQQYMNYANGAKETTRESDLDLELELFRAETLRSKKLLN